MTTELKFNSAEVRELVEHCKAAKEHVGGSNASDGQSGPGLYLAKDRGIYLMSNGKPNIPNKAGTGGFHVVYAQGFDPDKDGDVWMKSKVAVGGSDFADLLPLEMFEPWLKYAGIGVLVNADQIVVKGLFTWDEEVAK